MVREVGENELCGLRDGRRTNNMPTRFLFAEGVSLWWCALAGLTLLPFLIMTVWLWLPRREGSPPHESVLLNGVVLGAGAVMTLTSLWSTVAFIRASPSAGLARWVILLAVHFVVWAFLGSAILFATFHALGEGAPPRARRWAASGATAGVLLVQAASLYLTGYAATR